MLSGIVPTALTKAVSSDEGARNKAQAGDAFSQQLLSIIQNSLEKLGYSKSAVQIESKTVQSSVSTASGAASSPMCQFLVTLPAEASSPQNEQGSSAKVCTDEPPAVLFEQHEGFSPRLFATREAAEWAAARFGGEVGISQWEWSPWVTPPPPFYTIRFGDKEINAGLLVQYFEPGRFVGADQEAALALFREGIVNDYVLEHRPELIAEFGMPG